MRPYWRNLVSFQNSSDCRGVYLFNCIHALMSYQLTCLIRSSIMEFYNLLKDYRKGNCHLDKIMLRNTPLMTISVSVIGKSFSVATDQSLEKQIPNLYCIDSDDPVLNISDMFTKSDNDSEISVQSVNFILKNSGKMFIDPYMDDLEELFVNYFKQILNVGYKIPRMEYFMTQGW